MGKVVDIKSFASKHPKEPEEVVSELEKKFPVYLTKLRADPEFCGAMNYAMMVLVDILEANFDMEDGDVTTDDVVLLFEVIGSIVCRRMNVAHPFHDIAKDLCSPFLSYYHIKMEDGEMSEVKYTGNNEKPDDPEPPTNPDKVQ